MTFARKIFIAVFLSTLMVGSLLIWAAHRYVENRAESDFISRYSVFTKILADTLTRLDSNTEALMLNAAQVVAAKDKEKGLLSTDELRALQNKLGVTHLFVIDKTGRFVRSTNDDPAGIPDLFSFSPTYRKLLTGEAEVEATPVIKPNPEPKPFKFLSIANHDRSRIIEVGIRVDFIANTLAEAIKSDQNVLNMSLYAPDGTPFGTFTPSNVVFESQKAQLPTSLDTPINFGDSLKFYTKVKSSHTQCAQCDVSNTSVAGEYYYVLESSVSKAELNAINSNASYWFLIVGLANGILSWLLARFLSNRLVRNIETAVSRVRQIKEGGSSDERIKLKADDEVSFLTEEFDRLLDTLESSQKKLIEAEKVQSKVELARVVAHNIRSPIVAIEMMLPSLVTIPDRMKRTLKCSVDEIKALSDKLKTQSDSMNPNLNELGVDLVFLPVFLDDLVRQKNLEFSKRVNSVIEICIEQNCDSAFIKVNSFDLRSVLSNIINNASESYGPNGGKVVVTLNCSSNVFEIAISDSGAGIPQEYLPKLGNRQISLKGDSNRGMGLLHALKTIEALKGSIEIKSQLGVGTVVSIAFAKYCNSESEIKIAQGGVNHETYTAINDTKLASGDTNKILDFPEIKF